MNVCEGHCNGNRRSVIYMENDPRCCAGCGQSCTSGAKRGREETYRKVTRLAPTQHHHTGKVLAYVFGRRQDTVFLALKALLEPFGITRYFSDGWGAYERHVEAEQHTVGKAHTQKIESKHINLRTRIKRLVRRTICFSKTERMHALVIGLFINRYEFGRPI
jgi:insertion element IS1 protein InsB